MAKPHTSIGDLDINDPQQNWRVGRLAGLWVIVTEQGNPICIYKAHAKEKPSRGVYKRTVFTTRGQAAAQAARFNKYFGVDRFYIKFITP
jgi:hypothetical protein